MIGQRKLHEDAIDAGIGIERLNPAQQLRAAGFGRQLELVGIHPGFDGRPGFGADVDLARRVFADQDHRKARLAPRLPLETGSRFADPMTQPPGEGFAVDQRGGHSRALTTLRPPCC